MELKTSAQWLEEAFPDVEILDPDGWRGHTAPDFDKDEIPYDDFEYRLAVSTCRYPRGFFERFRK